METVEKKEKAPVIRNREMKRRDRKNYYNKTANLYPTRSWSKEECALVLEHSIPDSELSPKIQRSVKSIQEKRRRLKNEQAKS